MSLWFSTFIEDPLPRPVPLDAVDAGDDLFRMSYTFDTVRLRDSLRVSGLLHPLLLQERGNGRLRIVAGYRRYLACRELGWETVPVLLARVSEPEAVYRAVLLENLSHRPLNPVEISLALARLKAWGVAEGDLVREWLPRMGLDPSGKLLAAHLSVRELGEGARQALASGELAIGDVLLLLKWSGAEQGAVLGLFRDLKLGLNLRREIAVNLYEIQKRDGAPPSGILGGEEVRRVIEDPDLSVPQKAQAVRGIVRRCRYPVLTGMEEAFTARVSGLGLPPSITIQHPPFFEGESYRCAFTFRNAAEFRACAEKIRGIRDEEVFPEEDSA